MADIIQWRRGTAAEWTSANTLLADGEVGFETDTKKWKVGDAVTTWDSLPYQTTDFVPTTFAGAGTTGYVPDPLTETGLFLSDDGTFKQAPTSPVGGVFLNMRFNTDTNTATDPGLGDIKVNAGGDHLAATQMAASATTEPGNDATIVWESLEAGDFIGLWETSGDNEGIVYSVDSTPVDQGGWYQFDVTAIPGQTATGIDNNSSIQVFTIQNPARYLPAGGTTGQVLGKASDADYDTDWIDVATNLTDNVEYTVGTGGDFTTLADAVDFINTQPIGAGNADDGAGGTRTPRYTLTITEDQPETWRLEGVTAQVYITSASPAGFSIGAIGEMNTVSGCSQVSFDNVEIAGRLRFLDAFGLLSSGWDAPNGAILCASGGSVNIAASPLNSVGYIRVTNAGSVQCSDTNVFTIAPLNPTPLGNATPVPGITALDNCAFSFAGPVEINLTALPLVESVNLEGNSTLAIDGNLTLTGGGDSTEVTDYFAFDLNLNCSISVTGIYTGANFYTSLSDYLPGFNPGDAQGPIGVIQPDGSTYYSSTVQPWDYIDMRVARGEGVSTLANDKGYVTGIGASEIIVIDELPVPSDPNTLYFLTGTGGFVPPGPSPAPPNPASVVYFSGAESDFDPGDNPGSDVDGWGIETRSDRPSTDSISFSTDYSLNGTHSIKAGAVEAWGVDPNGKWRAEFKRPSGIFLEEGEEYWLGFSVLLPDTPSGNNQANLPLSESNNSMMQTHQMDTVISSKPQIHFHEGNFRGAMFNYYDRRIIAPINVGQWDIFVCHFKVSKGSDGFCDIWVNKNPGDAPNQSWTGPNMVPAESRFNLKFGMYRGPGAGTWAGITEVWQYYDEIRIAQGPNAKYEDVWAGSY